MLRQRLGQVTCYGGQLLQTDRQLSAEKEEIGSCEFARGELGGIEWKWASFGRELTFGQCLALVLTDANSCSFGSLSLFCSQQIKSDTCHRLRFAKTAVQKKQRLFSVKVSRLSFGEEREREREREREPSKKCVARLWEERASKAKERRQRKVIAYV